MLYTLKDVTLDRGEGAGYKLVIPSLRIDRAELVALTGPSGCGKSTCLDLLGMVLAPTGAGRFVFTSAGTDHDIASMWRKRQTDRMALLRRKHLAYILQTGDLLPFLQVGENIELAARLAGLDQNDASQRARQLLDELDIGRLAKAMPATLSVGERQRVAIARALAPAPDVILADEPTAALDPERAMTVMALFARMLKETGTAVIMVSHDVELVRKVGLKEVHIRTQTEEGSTVAVLDDQVQACSPTRNAQAGAQ